MNKVVIEEFNVCHQFADDIQFLLPLVERKFVNISHLVSCSNFIIFIGYNKNSYGDRIKEFIQRVIKKPQQSSLSDYGWAVHRPLVHQCKAPDYYDFSEQVQIIITIN